MPLVDRDPDRLIGTVLGGRFVVKQCAAVDEAGTRYDAWDDDLTSDASIRILHNVRPDDSSLKKLVELLTEVSGLGIEGIKGLRAVGRTRAKDVYYATEPITGEPLSDRLAAGPVPPREAVNVIAEAADVLAECHAKGVVHGGLHSGALLLPAPGGAKRVSLVDFGLGPITKAPDVLAAGASSASMPYQAPEQASNDPYDHRADVYAMGALLYAALTGRPPFAGSSVLEILAHQLRGEAPSLAKALPELGGTPLQAVIDRSMQVKPADRFPSLEEFGKALRAAGKEEAARKPKAAAAAPAAAAQVERKPPPKKAAEGRAGTSPYRGQAKGRGAYLAPGRQARWPYVLGAFVMVGSVAFFFVWDSVSAAGGDAIRGIAANADDLRERRFPAKAPEPAVPPTPEKSDAGRAKRAGSLSDVEIRGADAGPPRPLSDRAKQLLSEGNKALSEGQLQRAIARFRSAKRAAPGASMVARGLGLAYARAGQEDDAVTELRRYLALEPFAPDAAAIRAQIAALEQE